MNERCYGCGRGVDPQADGTYRRIAGWAPATDGTHAPSITIDVPATIDEWCCSPCHRAMVLAHHDWHQPSLDAEMFPQQEKLSQQTA
jgi:hypothetical protein